MNNVGIGWKAIPVSWRHSAAPRQWRKSVRTKAIGPASCFDSADVLFSSGDYTIDGSFDVPGSTLTLHRTKKYDAAANGLADYDSTHDYKMGELGFTRILPTPSV